MQRQDSPNQRERNIDQYQSRIPYVTEEDKEQNKDSDKTYRNHLRQALGSTHLIFKLTGPLNEVSGRNHDVSLNGLARLANGAAEVAPPYGKFYPDKTTIVITINEGRPCAGGNRGNLFERHLATAEGGNQNIANLPF